MGSPANYFMQIASMYNDMDNARVSNALQSRRLDQYDTTLAHNKQVYDDGQAALDRTEKAAYNSLAGDSQTEEVAVATDATKTLSMVDDLTKNFESGVGAIQLGNRKLEPIKNKFGYTFNEIDEDGTKKPLTVSNSKGEAVPVNMDTSTALKMSNINQGLSKDRPDLLPRAEGDFYGHTIDPETGAFVSKSAVPPTQGMDKILSGENPAPQPQAQTGGSLAQVTPPSAGIAHTSPVGKNGSFKVPDALIAKDGWQQNKLAGKHFGREVEPIAAPTPTAEAVNLENGGLEAGSTEAPDSGVNIGDATIKAEFNKHFSQVPEADAQKEAAKILDGETTLTRTRNHKARAKQAATLVRTGAITMQQAENFVKHGTFSMSDKDFIDLGVTERAAVLAQEKQMLVQKGYELKVQEHYRKLDNDRREGRLGGKDGTTKINSSFFKSVDPKGDYSVAGVALDSGILMYKDQTGIDPAAPEHRELYNAAITKLSEVYKKGVAITPAMVGQTIMKATMAVYEPSIGETVKPILAKIAAPMSNGLKYKLYQRMSGLNEAGQQAMIKELERLPPDQRQQLLAAE